MARCAKDHPSNHIVYPPYFGMYESSDIRNVRNTEKIAAIYSQEKQGIHREDVKSINHKIIFLLEAK